MSVGTDPITGEGWVMKLLWGRGNGPAASVLLAVAAMVLFVLAATPARAAGESENPERRQFFPIGDHDTEVKKLKEEYIPFGTEGKGEGDIPPRPKLLIEQGDPFLAPGNLNAGFVLPGLGTIVQPRLWTYMFYRTTLQSFDNGAPGRERETEWANRLDLFFNLQLTGTEKILLGLRPVDKNQQNEFTRYTFAGADEGFNQEFNINVETFFFEGDFGSLAPVFDPAGIKPIDYGFTIGRQLITFQEGMLINDTVDAIGIVRNNIPLRGTSNFRASAMWAWNRLDRNDQFRGTNDDMFALFLAADTYVSTYNLDMIYVLEDGRIVEQGDAVDSRAAGQGERLLELVIRLPIEIVGGYAQQDFLPAVGIESPVLEGFATVMHVGPERDEPCIGGQYEIRVDAVVGVAGWNPEAVINGGRRF